MATIKLTCPECKTTNKKIPKTKRIVPCKKCGYPMFNNAEKKERFKRFKKITGIQKSNEAKERVDNLAELHVSVKNLYHLIDEDFSKKNLKGVRSKLSQLFQLDNSNNSKYLCLFFVQLKVTSSEDAYDGFRKLSKKKRSALLQTNYVQHLHMVPEYRSLIDDIILHTYVKRKKMGDRIQIRVMGG